MTNATGIKAFKKSKVYKSGRVCKLPECTTPLSIYNSGKYCGPHQHLHPQHIRMRGRAKTDI